jgi:lipopolysaccharide heptosyltransferase I
MTVYKKKLIIKPSSLGDVVHSLAFLNAIKTCYPDASIHWVLSKGLEDLLDGHPMIEKLWIIDKDKWKSPSHFLKTIIEFRNLSKSLKAENFDLVVDLQGLFRSGLIASLTKARDIIGFREAREGSRFFYTRQIEGGNKIHAVDRYLRIAGSLGCNVSDIRFPLNTSNNFGELKNKFSLPDEYIIVVPGARWNTKRWPAERFGKVSSELNVRSVIVGSGSDSEVAEVAKNNSGGNAISLAGKTTLKELIAIIKNARFMLTNDTGPMHMAAALQVPVYAVFGPTDDTLTGPYGKKKVVFKSDSDCSPCFKKDCDNMKCMEGVAVDTVVSEIKKDMDLP